jgi:hypothetical protein
LGLSKQEASPVIAERLDIAKILTDHPKPRRRFMHMGLFLVVKFFCFRIQQESDQPIFMKMTEIFLVWQPQEP